MSSFVITLVPTTLTNRTYLTLIPTLTGMGDSGKLHYRSVDQVSIFHNSSGIFTAHSDMHIYTQLGQLRTTKHIYMHLYYYLQCINLINNHHRP